MGLEDGGVEEPPPPFAGGGAFDSWASLGGGFACSGSSSKRSFLFVIAQRSSYCIDATNGPSCAHYWRGGHEVNMNKVSM
jgi:hypothetical protein